jgi:hypothetical protein
MGLKTREFGIITIYIKEYIIFKIFYINDNEMKYNEMKGELKTT